MSRFGWAYVNSEFTGAVANGPDKSIQFASGSSQKISGSSNLTFDYNTNTLYLTGTLRADTLIVSASQILKSGSTIFGDDISDTHQFTGSIYNTTLISGSTLDISGVSVLSGQVRAFGGIQARNSNILVTSTNGLTNYVTLTTAGLVSGTTAQFSVITGSAITGSTSLLTTLSASYISSSIITFDTSLAADPTFKTGQVFYSPDTNDLSFHTNVTDIKLNIGQQTILKVKNSSGTTINKGKIVHITGGVGDTPLINTASWENDANSANTLGMVMRDIAHDNFGYVMLNGVITNVNTDPATFTAGQIIYLSSSGDYTAISPIAPKHNVRIGEVIRAHATVGSIFINIDNGYELDELHNVLITSASTGDLIVYNSSSAVWENTKTLSGSYILSGSLTITGSSTDNTLKITDVGVVFPSAVRTSNFSINAQDYIIYASGSALTGTLSSSQNGRMVMIYNYGSTNIFLTGSGITGFVAPNGSDVATLNITLNPRVVQLLYFTTTNRWIVI